MYLVCDLECTSPQPLVAQILSGTFIAVDKDLGPISEFNVRCRPFRWDKDAEDSSKIHGITREMVEGLPLFHEELDRLFSWLSIYPFKHFVCHARRDMFGKRTTYDHAVLRTSIFPSDKYWVFTAMFREIDIISTHSLAMYLDKMFNFDKKDLKSVCHTLGIELKNHHSDRDDAYACLEILKRLLPMVEMREFLDWDNYRLEVLNERSERLGKKYSKPPRRSPDYSRKLQGISL